jgi:hypothetical protein
MLVSISEERGDFSNLLVTAYIDKLYVVFNAWSRTGTEPLPPSINDMG